MTNQITQSPSNCAPAHIIAKWNEHDPDFDLDNSPTIEELFCPNRATKNKTYNIDWTWLEDHIEEVIEMDKACEEWVNENSTSARQMVWHYEYFKSCDDIETLRPITQNK